MAVRIQVGSRFLPASSSSVIAASTTAGKMATWGRPYFVSLILIGGYDNRKGVLNQEMRGGRNVTVFCDFSGVRGY